MSLAARVLVSRAAAVNRKAARQRRHRLERELADYSSAAELCDLEATLERYSDGQTHELREILTHQETVRRASRFPAIGRN